MFFQKLLFVLILVFLKLACVCHKWRWSLLILQKRIRELLQRRLLYTRYYGEKIEKKMNKKRKKIQYLCVLHRIFYLPISIPFIALFFNSTYRNRFGFALTQTSRFNTHETEKVRRWSQQVRSRGVLPTNVGQTRIYVL